MSEGRSRAIDNSILYSLNFIKTLSENLDSKGKLSDLYRNSLNKIYNEIGSDYVVRGKRPRSLDLEIFMGKFSQELKSS